MTRRARRWWLPALWLAFGCTEGSSSQVLTGRVDTTGVVAIRAVSGSDVVTAAQVASDGTFRIALPAGARYRLEVLTSDGVKQVLKHDDGSWKDMTFKVCVPTDPFDIGGIGKSTDPGCGGGGTGGTCDDPTDPNCKPTPCDDPMDPNCQPPPPPPSCGGANEPPCPECMDPSDPNCKPPPCTDPMDPNCQPPACGGTNEPPCPCMDPSDPNCKPPPCNDPMDPHCGGMCDPGDPNCGTGPICEDPMDPSTCKDPCMIDPMQCGCTMNEPNCWPPPEPPTCMPGGTCDPNDAMAPTKVPGDFGCAGVFGT